MDELIHSKFEIFKVSAVLYFFVFIIIILRECLKKKIIQILVKDSKQDFIWGWGWGYYSGVLQSGREIRLTSAAYSKGKWEFIAKEQSEGVSGWEIIKGKHQGLGGFFLDQLSTEFLLKAGQGDKILWVGAEEFDQILRVIRYQGQGIFTKLTQQDSC